MGKCVGRGAGDGEKNNKETKSSQIADQPKKKVGCIPSLHVILMTFPVIPRGVSRSRYINFILLVFRCQDGGGIFFAEWGNGESGKGLSVSSLSIETMTVRNASSQNRPHTFSSARKGRDRLVTVYDSFLVTTTCITAASLHSFATPPPFPPPPQRREGPKKNTSLTARS